jgi:hypothetical protein
MKISRVVIGLGCAALLGVAFAQSIKQISVALGDKTLKLNSVVVKGETYVSLKQLKAAFPVLTGGANQAAGTTGCVNQMLFNGAWRFRVQKIAYNLEKTAWVLTVELRNAMTKTAHAYDSGANGLGEDITLTLASGNTLNMGNSAMLEAQDKLILKDLAAGAGVVTTLEFNADSDTDKPTKFLWAMNAGNNNNKAPLSKDPAFRIDLTCTK